MTVNEVCLAVADKECFFVILDRRAFCEKGAAAMQKNFVPASEESMTVVKTAQALLNDMNLQDLASQVKMAEKLELEVFF